jgi:hypothetical protein
VTVYYAVVLAALLRLTALTTAVAFVDLGRLSAPVALVIACLPAFHTARIQPSTEDAHLGST